MTLQQCSSFLGEGPGLGESDQPVFCLYKFLSCEVSTSGVWVWWSTLLEPVIESQAPGSDGDQLMIAAIFLLESWRGSCLDNTAADDRLLWSGEWSSWWLAGNLDGIHKQPARSIPPQVMGQEVFRHHPSGGTICRVISSGHMPP